MLSISHDAASDRVMYESIVITGRFLKNFETVVGARVDLDSLLGSSVHGLSHEGFLYGA